MFFPAIALLGGLVSGSAAADEASIERGRALSGTCLGCHGVPSYTNVYPSYRVPKLGGQHVEYLVAALMAYRSGERQHATMQAQSMRLSDAQMRDIAVYLASLQ